MLPSFRIAADLADVADPLSVLLILLNRKVVVILESLPASVTAPKINWLIKVMLTLIFTAPRAISSRSVALIELAPRLVRAATGALTPLVVDDVLGLTLLSEKHAGLTVTLTAMRVVSGVVLIPRLVFTALGALPALVIDSEFRGVESASACGSKLSVQASARLSCAALEVRRHRPDLIAALAATDDDSTTPAKTIHRDNSKASEYITWINDDSNGPTATAALVAPARLRASKLRENDDLLSTAVALNLQSSGSAPTSGDMKSLLKRSK